MTDTLTGCQDRGARTPKCLLGCHGITKGTCQPGASASTTSDQWGHAVELWGSRVQARTDPVPLPCQQTHSPPRSYTHFTKGPPQATLLFAILPTHNERSSSDGAGGSARLQFTGSRTFGTQRPHEYEKTFAASFFWVWSSFAPHLLSLCFLKYMRIDGGHIISLLSLFSENPVLKRDHKKEYSGFVFFFCPFDLKSNLSRKKVTVNDMSPPISVTKVQIFNNKYLRIKILKHSV